MGNPELTEAASRLTDASKPLPTEEIAQKGAET